MSHCMLIYVKDVKVSVFHRYTSSLKKERKKKTHTHTHTHIYIYIYMQNEWMIKNAKLRKGLVIEIVSLIPKDIYT